MFGKIGANDAAPAANRWWLVLVLAVLALSALPRFAGSSKQMLSRDEGFSWRMSTYSPSDLLRHAPGGSNPPLYYFVLKGWTAVVGISPAAMRSLSVLFSVAALGVLYLLCREFVGQGGALFAVVLAALHAGQVAVAPVARMYGLGVFLAALTAWLLVRALRAGTWHSPWWTGYGLAVAAFCYTHYYAFFTVLAQMPFVIGDLLLRGRSGKWRAAGSSAGGFFLAGCVATLVFAPWLPGFLSQVRDVQEGWWGGPVTAGELEKLVFSWLTGMQYEGPFESRLLLALFGVLILATLALGGRWAWFFLLQAVLPWFGAVAVFLLTERNITQDRYFVFAQTGLFGLWSIAWQFLSGRTARLLLVVFLFPPMVGGLAEHLNQRPEGIPALQEAAEWLGTQEVDNDLFVIEDYRYINLFRYYTSLAGLACLDVKAPAPPLTKGHIVHLGSLEGSDLYWSEDELWRRAPARVWLVEIDGRSPSVQPPARKTVLKREFKGGWDSSVTLERCEPES